MVTGCDATPSPTTATAGPLAVSRLTPAALRFAATVPSVPTTVCWSVVVPFQVIANDAVSGHAGRDQHLAEVHRPGLGARITRVPSVAETRLASLAWMIRTSPVPSLVSGTPASPAPRWPRTRRG